MSNEAYANVGNKLQITQTATQVITSTWEDLQAERAVYVQQKQADDDKNNANIARMDGLIAQATTLGITPTVSS